MNEAATAQSLSVLSHTDNHVNCDHFAPKLVMSEALIVVALYLASSCMRQTREESHSAQASQHSFGYKHVVDTYRCCLTYCSLGTGTM